MTLIDTIKQVLLTSLRIYKDINIDDLHVIYYDSTKVMAAEKKRRIAELECNWFSLPEGLRKNLTSEPFSVCIGSFHPKDVAGYCGNDKNTICILLSQDHVNDSVFFHEIGHAIDVRLGDSEKHYSLTSPELRKSLLEDLRSKEGVTYEEMSNEMETNIKELFACIVSSIFCQSFQYLDYKSYPLVQFILQQYSRKA